MKSKCKKHKRTLVVAIVILVALAIIVGVVTRRGQESGASASPSVPTTKPRDVVSPYTGASSSRTPMALPTTSPTMQRPRLVGMPVGPALCNPNAVQSIYQQTCKSSLYPCSSLPDPAQVVSCSLTLPQRKVSNLHFPEWVKQCKELTVQAGTNLQKALTLFTGGGGGNPEDLTKWVDNAMDIDYGKCVQQIVEAAQKAHDLELLVEDITESEHLVGIISDILHKFLQLH